jgi:hypothetical protein
MADESLPVPQRTEKRCTKCGAVKPVSGFAQRRNGRTESWCKACVNEYQSKYRKARESPEARLRRLERAREYQRLRKAIDPAYKAKSIEAVQDWWRSLPEEKRRELNQRKKIVARYGISLVDWQLMFERQGGVCAICNDPPSKPRNFHVDHCHKTGRVRGLLCVRCNTSLGWFERVQGSMHRLHAYLKEPELAHVIEEGVVEFRGKVIEV